MKRYWAMVLLILAMVFALTACNDIPAQNGEGDPTGGEDDTAGAIYYGKIVALDGDTMMLVATGESANSADVCRNSLSGLTITDNDGNAMGTTELSPGMLVEVAFSGQIMETYPAQLDNPTTVKVVGQEADLVGFYLGVLNDLYEVDPGLNSDISILGFDLSEVENLSAAEKSALVWLMGEEKGLETVTGTFDELAENGYIDKENLYFANGILLSIDTGDISENSFKFDAEKWRGGLGAYFFTDCTATNNNGTWSYSVGAEAIS